MTTVFIISAPSGSGKSSLATGLPGVECLATPTPQGKSGGNRRRPSLVESVGAFVDGRARRRYPRTVPSEVTRERSLNLE